MRDQTAASLPCSSSRYTRYNILGKVAFLLLCIAGCTQAASKDGVHPEQVLTGPIYQVGDYIECVYGQEAKYCMTQVQLKAANSSSPFWIKIQEVSKRQTHFRRDLLYVGLCVPAQSSVSDFSKGFEDSLNDAARKLGVTAEVELDEQKCQSKHGPPYSAAHFLTLFGSLGLIFLVLCGSRYSYDGLRRLKKNETPVITRGETFLLCFSLQLNWKKFCATSSCDNPRDFRAISCVRTLIGCIFVLPHAFLQTLHGPIRNPAWIEESYSNVFWASVYNCSVFLAVFFYIGGFLLSYSLLRELDRKKIFKWPDFFMIVIKRYIRLTVVYAVAVAFGATWYIHMSEGPMWNSVVGTEAENCRRNWWINLLYLSNYYKVEEMCMPQSWYLAVDFQCHIVATLIVIVVWKHPRYAKAVLAGVLFASALTSFIQTYVEGLNPLFLLYPQTGKHLFMDKTFQRAHITFPQNFGAYFVGVIFGYIHHNTTHTSVKWTKVGHCVVWLIALTAILFTHLISTVFYQPSYKHNILIASLYACSYDIIIAAATGTILTSCALGHGGIINRIASSKPFQILGPLSYCMYLIHFYVIAVQISSSKEPFDISGPWLTYITLSVIVMSYTLAVPLYLLVEMPSSALFKWLLTEGRRNGKQH